VKDALRRSVGIFPGMKFDGPADVTDALAIAKTHCTHARAAALRAM